METAAAEQAAQGKSSSLFHSTGQVATAWFAISIASDLDSIVAHLLHLSPPDLAVSLAKFVILCMMALSVRFFVKAPYLERFVWVLAALIGGEYVAVSIQAHVLWFQGAPHAQFMFARVLLSFIPVALAALTLFGSGLTRHDIFLAIGTLSAHTGLPLLRRFRWNVVAPLLLVVISAGLLVQLWIVSNASRHYRSGMLLAALPVGIVFAALNSFSEEFRFRCLLLAYGSRTMGVAQAITATSLLFGTAHFGGHPSGFSGVAMAAFFAWIVARSMFDTRGLGWAWSLHFIQDLIIFLMVTMTGV